MKTNKPNSRSLTMKTIGQKLALAASVSALSCALLSTQAFAQSGPSLDEIVVTAQVRAAGLQDVPISMAAVSADTIKENSIVKIEDLKNLVPNFTYTETGISTGFFLRGIGSGINQGFEQSVGVYVDGVNLPRGQQVRNPFLDVERIEVLRGPQSILFGKNSVAGAISVHSAKPTAEFEGSVLGSVEFEDGEHSLDGYISGPINDRVRARIAGRYRNVDGYMHNLTSNEDEAAREEIALRGTLEVDLAENLLATFKLEHSTFDVTGRNNEIENPQAALAGPFTGLTYSQILVNVFGQDESALNDFKDGNRSSNGDLSENKLQSAQMKLNWDIGDFKLESNTNYQTIVSDELGDADGVGANLFKLEIDEEYKQFSQEFRLTSPIGDKFDYILGAYFQSSDHDFSDNILIDNTSILVPVINLRSPGSGSLISDTAVGRSAIVDTTIFSAFAQANWHMSADLTLQLGGRVTNDRRKGTKSLTATSIDGSPLSAAQAAAPIVYAGLFNISTTNLANLGPTGAYLISTLGQSDVADELEETTFSPDVKLVWDVSDDTMLYASWARGYKAGGFDFRGNNKGNALTNQDAFSYNKEIATNYEIGGKFKIGSAAELNATAFFTKFDDLQISIFDGTLGFNVGNAATAEIKGLELDGRWALTDAVTLTGGMALTDFEFTDFKNGQCYVGRTPDFANGLCDFTGNSNQLVSDFTANLALNGHMSLGDNYELKGLASVFYASAYDAANTFDPAGRQDAYAKLNVRLGLSPTDGNWELALLGKNLTDEIVRTFSGDVPLAGSSFGAKTNYAFFDQGRTITLQARYNF